jgi:hypothetical protein
MAMICHPPERDLIVAGATQLVAPGDRTKCPADTDGDGDCAACSRYPDVHGFVAPQRWVDATGPCPTCDGLGGYEVFAADPVRHGKCPDCKHGQPDFDAPGYGRKREALQVECEHPAESVRTVPNGKSTMDVCDRCRAHRFPFGEWDDNVITFAYCSVAIEPNEDGRTFTIILSNVELAP